MPFKTKFQIFVNVMSALFILISISGIACLGVAQYISSNLLQTLGIILFLGGFVLFLLRYPILHAHKKRLEKDFALMREFMEGDQKIIREALPEGKKREKDSPQKVLQQIKAYLKNKQKQEREHGVLPESAPKVEKENKKTKKQKVKKIKQPKQKKGGKHICKKCGTVMKLDAFGTYICPHCNADELPSAAAKRIKDRTSGANLTRLGIMTGDDELDKIQVTQTEDPIFDDEDYSDPELDDVDLDLDEELDDDEDVSEMGGDEIAKMSKELDDWNKKISDMDMDDDEDAIEDDEEGFLTTDDLIEEKDAKRKKNYDDDEESIEWEDALDTEKDDD